MAGDAGEGSSSIDLEQGLQLQQACAASLEEKIARLPRENRGEYAKRPSIWMVYSHLRNKDPKAYEPKLVSIGPFHHGKEALSSMEELKLENMRYILEKFQGISVQHYVREVFTLLARVRAEYSEKIDLSDDKFAEMLVIDGCFIIGLLKNFDPIHESSFVTQVRGGYDFVWEDLMLFENQMPLFVVRKLLDVIGAECDIVETVLKKICLDIPKERHPEERDCRHLLHLKYLSLDPDRIWDVSSRRPYSRRGIFLVKKLVHWIFFPLIALLYLILSRDCSGLFGAPKASRKTKTRSTIPSATELYETGVEFRAISMLEQNSSYIVPRACFKHGTLEIPWLSVDESTFSELRNLIAFEQCFREVEPHFTNYCFFLDDLISTANDVAILRRCGVLENMIGCDTELAEKINGLCKGTYGNHLETPFEDLYEELTTFCEVAHHKWRATLSHKYFSNPWTLTSVLAAATLIAFTVTQTVFAMKQVK